MSAHICNPRNIQFYNFILQFSVTFGWICINQFKRSVFKRRSLFNPPHSKSAFKKRLSWLCFASEPWLLLLLVQNLRNLRQSHILGCPPPAFWSFVFINPFSGKLFFFFFEIYCFWFGLFWVLHPTTIDIKRNLKIVKFKLGGIIYFVMFKHFKNGFVFSFLGLICVREKKQISFRSEDRVCFLNPKWKRLFTPRTSKVILPLLNFHSKVTWTITKRISYLK